MAAQCKITDDELIEMYHRQGVVLLANAIEPSALHTLSTLFANCLENPSPLAQRPLRAEPHVNDGNYHDSFLHIGCEELVPLLRQLHCLSLIMHALQSHQLNLFNSELAIKHTDTSVETPWHDSISYLPLQGYDIATLWVPLDPIDSKSGGIEFGKKHHGHHTKLTSWHLQPGDALLYNADIAHRELSNQCLDFPRRVMLFRLVGEQACYQPKPFSVPLLWSPHLNVGDHINQDDMLFPSLNIYLS